MRTKIWRAILFILSFVAVIIVVAVALALKLTNRYRPSVYNYESYLSPNIIQKLKEKYNYKEFKEINEFTQALTQEKAIAGVGSDFQAAQLIIDKKIQKFNFELIYGKGANEWENRKQFYTKTVIKHMEDFDALILSTLDNMEKEGRETGFIIQRDSQGKALNYRLGSEKPSEFNGGWDHFYDYILPYYSQDKGVAYNINENTRPNLNINLAQEELNEQSEKLSWQDVFHYLRNAKYTHFGWTNAYIDNLMIGAMTYGEDWKNKFTKVVNGTRLFDFNEENYKDAIDSFNKFIFEATGHDIKSTQFNFMSSDGLELLNHLIEPKVGRSDAAVMYNGDALDAYYSEDNFASVEEGKIRFVRPKYNYLLLDNWILSSGLTREEADEFTKTLAEVLYHNNIGTNGDLQHPMATSLEQIEKEFFGDFKEELNDEVVAEQKEAFEGNITSLSDEKVADLINLFIEKNLASETSLTKENFESWNTEKFDAFVKNPALKENYEWILVLRDNLESDNGLFSDLFGDLFTDSSVAEISNFDYVSYTPTNLLTYEFIRKWYFAGDDTAIQIFEQPAPSETYELYSYPIINNNLRTKIAAYYYESTRS
ncbi:hypothetical protein [Metamycoplasma neophronis]|uniref:Spermidine/putrescine transport system substrate-binding protein n=1 Tax=Metamycoplasma neophronis TaxID=872983 RepID=A0ABY2Z0H7_9BACT|nr:hypothetical protein [Metamycoplasma neophronis]TPR53888.1 hypothetical protein FJR74_01850 [Metamycoplasma neophronis]